MRWLALIVPALLQADTAAAQSPAGHSLAMGLLDACRVAQATDVIWVGRPLAAGGPGLSRLIPVEVEAAFRGVSAQTVIMVSWEGDRTFEADQSYLMHGLKEAGSSVLQLQDFAPANSDFARKTIQLYASAMPQSGYVTLMGVVEVGSHPHSAPSLPLAGLRIRLQSDNYTKDLFTEKNGEFTAGGIPPGRLQLMPALPDTLKVFDVKALTYTATADECVLQLIFVVSSGPTH